MGLGGGSRPFGFRLGFCGTLGISGAGGLVTDGGGITPVESIGLADTIVISGLPLGLKKMLKIMLMVQGRVCFNHACEQTGSLVKYRRLQTNKQTKEKRTQTSAFLSPKTAPGIFKFKSTKRLTKKADYKMCLYSQRGDPRPFEPLLTRRIKKPKGKLIRRFLSYILQGNLFSCLHKGLKVNTQLNS